MSVIDSINFRESWLIFLGMWVEAELILRIWVAKEKYFQGAEVLSFREFGDQCIIFRDKGSTDPPGGLKTLFMNILNSGRGHSTSKSRHFVSLYNSCNPQSKSYKRGMHIMRMPWCILKLTHLHLLISLHLAEIIGRLLCLIWIAAQWYGLEVIKLEYTCPQAANH